YGYVGLPVAGEIADGGAVLAGESGARVVELWSGHSDHAAVVRAGEVVDGDLIVRRTGLASDHLARAVAVQVARADGGRGGVDRRRRVERVGREPGGERRWRTGVVRRAEQAPGEQACSRR